MNHRMPDNYPLRTVVMSGNLMAAALEHADMYEALEITSLIETWNGAIKRAAESNMPIYLTLSGNVLITGLKHRGLLTAQEIDYFIAGWRSSIDSLRNAEITRQQEAA
ncbi:hypothetical protein [Sulfuriferula sp.]|uniref:hypothetical protein n=1 Tax=Sulfuriferula sp. TaxID=2025307 RepID=UPI002732079E|nr:hypothetical protein [Sulfuriferula sp.]MDP2026419.1 hypothetical protein [Sulfuriferula sp.]